MDDKSKVKKKIDGPLRLPPRKGGLKFAPKVPQKKPAKVVPKKEPVEESKEEAVDKELLMKLKIAQNNKYPSARIKSEEKPKSGTQVAFGQGNSSYARHFTMPKKDSSADGASKLTKEYAEPWDYTHDYPVTLPLRRPYSGNPEILDEEEFGESSASRAQDAKLSAAEELGLMDRVAESQFLLFQFPTSLPLPRQPQSVVDANVVYDERRDGMRPSSYIGSKLKEIPEGYMGKILVYSSGKVKMKIGDTLFDVSSGSNCMFVQEVEAINAREKHCCTVGEITKRVVVSPQILTTCWVLLTRWKNSPFGSFRTNHDHIISITKGSFASYREQPVIPFQIYLYICLTYIDKDSFLRCFTSGIWGKKFLI